MQEDRSATPGGPRANDPPSLDEQLRDLVGPTSSRPPARRTMAVVLRVDVCCSRAGAGHGAVVAGVTVELGGSRRADSRGVRHGSRRDLHHRPFRSGRGAVRELMGGVTGRAPRALADPGAKSPGRAPSGAGTPVCSGRARR